MPTKTILLVDDSPTQVRTLQSALQGHGYQLETAADGEEALAKVLIQRPDMVLLDVVLPKKNGFQVCRQLKTAPETRGTKVIMVTSKTHASDRFWGLRQGADEFVTKPVNPEELLELVARHL
jgi:twitching motility two-component system response regulator PilH